MPPRGLPPNFIQINCFKGAHLTLSEIQFEGAHLRILQGAHFNPKNRDICLICDKSAYATSQMCPLRQLCAPNHGCRGCKIKGPGVYMHTHTRNTPIHVPPPPALNRVKGAHLSPLSVQCIGHNSEMCLLKQLCASSHGSRGRKIKGPGQRGKFVSKI